MINNNLLEEIINISTKDNFVSQDLLRRITFDVVSTLDNSAKSKFNDLNFTDIDFKFAVGRCIKEEGIIEVDYNKLITKYKRFSNYPKLQLNLLIIQYILHELEHINEFYKITKNDFESKLISISLYDFIINLFDNLAFSKISDEEKALDYADQLYLEYSEKNWKIQPNEKIAEADSYKRILCSLDEYADFNTKCLETYNFILDKYYDSLKTGYKYNAEKKKYNVPLLDYLLVLKSIGCEFALKEKENKTKANTNRFLVEDRMKFGFKVSKEEIENLGKQKILKY